MTLIFTTSNRIEYFTKTLQSLIKNCMDLFLVENVIVVDDSSSSNEFNKIQKLISFYFSKTKNLIYTHNKKSHFYSIKILFELINDEFIFLCEDDWLFTNRCDFISKSLDILNKKENIGQIILSWGNCFYRDLPERVDKSRFRITDNGTIYYEWNYDTKINNREKWIGWPNFSLNPSIISLEKLKKNNLFFREEDDFEYKFAQNYTNSGLISVLLPCYLVKHIGEISAYNINKSQR